MKYFLWNIPYQPPDSAAIERMRQHFPKPADLMPAAWFMGGVTFLKEFDTTAPEALTTDRLAYAMSEIRVGIEAFPNVSYISVWKEWFRYLLPYAIATTDSRKDEDTMFSLYCEMFKALMNIYPQQITEEYPGFRDDVVYTLGTCVIPELLSRDDPALKTPDNASLQNPVFNDIWDCTNSPGLETPGLYEEFDLPMQFCLRYLNSFEIETWVESLLKIDSPQWHLAVITWWLGRYASVATDASISAANSDGFTTAMTHNFTRDRFLEWAAEIKSHQTFRTLDDYTFPIGADLALVIEQALSNFEKAFFKS